MARRPSRTSISTSVEDVLGLRSLPVLNGLARARAIVRAIEDRRRWDPLGGLHPAGALERSSRALVENLPAGPRVASRFSFAVPNRVAICVRRKTRREVLFAERKTGKGAKAPRRRNRWSDIGCK